MLESFDLGEPDETRKEVLENDDEEADGSSVITSLISDESEEAVQYSQVDEDAESIDDLDEVFAEADTLTTEVFGDSIIDFADEDDYGFIDM